MPQYDRTTASSKASSPQSAIECFLFPVPLYSFTLRHPVATYHYKWNSAANLISTQSKGNSTLYVGQHVWKDAVHYAMASSKIVLRVLFKWPAWWSSGQSFWLLIMRSRVRFPILPWGFFREGEDPHGDHGLGSLVEFRFKAPPGTSYSYIT
jgi:hypothetical protein